MDKKEISIYIKAFKLAKNITTKEIEEKTNIHRNDLIRISEGRGYRIDALLKYLDALIKHQSTHPSKNINKTLTLIYCLARNKIKSYLV